VPLLTVLGDATQEVEAEVTGGRMLVSAAALEVATGWHLEDRGLCRGDACVPLRDRGAVVDGDRVDLPGVARVLDAPVVHDDLRGVLAFGRPGFERRRVVGGREAVSVALPDLHGDLHELSEWSRRRRMLVAFASW
jgi:hypothetical protein